MKLIQIDESVETYYVVKERIKANFAFKNIHILSFGPERDRTADPLLAKQVLSQLSYRPATGLTATLRVSWAYWWAQVDSNH